MRAGRVLAAALALSVLAPGLRAQRPAEKPIDVRGVRVSRVDVGVDARGSARAVQSGAVGCPSVSRPSAVR